MRLHRGWGLATLAAVLLAASATRADFIIDDFSTSSDVTVKAMPAGPRSANQGATAAVGATIVGNARNLQVNRMGSPTTTASIEGVSNDLDANRFDFLTSSTAIGNVVLKYDGTTGVALNPTGLGGQDVTQLGGNNAFRVTGFSDLGVGVTLTLYTDATHYSTGFVLLPGTGFAGVDGNFDIPFSMLTAGVGAAGAATLTSIGAIVVTVDDTSVGTGQGADANLTTIFFARAVPEPASFALVGLGLMTSGFVAYRRRKTAK